MDPGDVVTPAAYILFYSAIEGQTSLPPLGQYLNKINFHVKFNFSSSKQPVEPYLYCFSG